MSPAKAKSDLVYATTDDGLRLPVIDITQPAFALPDDPASVAALDAAFRESETRNALMPRFIMHFMMRAAARRSRLLADILDPDTSFLAGLTTYIMKLGVENLPPPFDSDTDRRLVSSPQVTAMRLRLQQTVKLIAGALEPLLLAAPAAPLVLVNIGGGPAIDSIDALILLRRAQGDASDLLRRPIAIQVLDIDAAGPHFGAAALAALSAEGQPLAGLDIAFTHQPYRLECAGAARRYGRSCGGTRRDHRGVLRGRLVRIWRRRSHRRQSQGVAYGGTKAVVGSVTNADPVRRRSVTGSRFKLLPRGLDGFRPLAERSGFRIARSEATPLGDQILLCPT